MRPARNYHSDCPGCIKPKTCKPAKAGFLWKEVTDGECSKRRYFEEETLQRDRADDGCCPPCCITHNIDKMKQVPYRDYLLLTNYLDLAEEAGLLGVKVLNRLSGWSFTLVNLADLINESICRTFLWAVPVSQ